MCNLLLASCRKRQSYWIQLGFRELAIPGRFTRLLSGALFGLVATITLINLFQASIQVDNPFLLFA